MLQSGKDADYNVGDGDYATGCWICIQINRWTNTRNLFTAFYSQNVDIQVWFTVSPSFSQEGIGYISSENFYATFLQLEEETHSVLHQEDLDYLNLTIMDYQSKILFHNRSILTVQLSLKDISIFLSEYMKADKAKCRASQLLPEVGLSSLWCFVKLNPLEDSVN